MEKKKTLSEKVNKIKKQVMIAFALNWPGVLPFKEDETEYKRPGAKMEKTKDPNVFIIDGDEHKKDTAGNGIIVSPTAEEIDKIVGKEESGSLIEVDYPRKAKEGKGVIIIPTGAALNHFVPPDKSRLIVSDGKPKKTIPDFFKLSGSYMVKEKRKPIKPDDTPPAA